MLRENILNELCAENKVSLYALSKETGISKSYIYNLANGTYKNPSHAYFKQIADFFSVDTIVLKDWTRK